MTTSDFKKLKGSCQQTNVSLGLGEMEYVYSISQVAKYLSVYSLHSSAKNRRTRISFFPVSTSMNAFQALLLSWQAQHFGSSKPALPGASGPPPTCALS